MSTARSSHSMKLPEGPREKKHPRHNVRGCLKKRARGDSNPDVQHGRPLFERRTIPFPAPDFGSQVRPQREAIRSTTAKLAATRQPTAVALHSARRDRVRALREAGLPWARIAHETGLSIRRI